MIAIPPSKISNSDSSSHAGMMGLV